MTESSETPKAPNPTANNCQHKFNIYYSEDADNFYCKDCKQGLGNDYFKNNKYTEYNHMIAWARGHPNWPQEYVEMLTIRETEELTGDELRDAIDYQLSFKLSYGESARLLSVNLNIVSNCLMYHYSGQTALSFLGRDSKYLIERNNTKEKQQ